MAYQLKHGKVGKDESLLVGALGCFDTIGEEGFDHDRDETLHERSAYEFVRDQLTDAQRSELDLVDAHWRDHADDFNAAFVATHEYADRNLALADWVVDGDGRPAPIPRSHWWWRPIAGENE